MSKRQIAARPNIAQSRLSFEQIELLMRRSRIERSTCIHAMAAVCASAIVRSLRSAAALFGVPAAARAR